MHDQTDFVGAFSSKYFGEFGTVVIHPQKREKKVWSFAHFVINCPKLLLLTFFLRQIHQSLEVRILMQPLSLAGLILQQI